MAKIYFIHDYSASRHWLHAALAAQADALGNIVIGKFSEWACVAVKSHNTLWEDQYTPTLPPWYIMGQLDQVKAAIAQGRDILLYGEPLRISQLDFFWRILAQYIDCQAQEFNALFIMSHPAAILERHCREYSLKPGGNAGALCKQLATFPAFLENYCQRIGREHCAFISNGQYEPFLPAPGNIFSQVSNFLGVELTPMQDAPLNPLSFRSHSSRRLENCPEVRENAWPGLDNSALHMALPAFDATLNEDFLSPLAMRQTFADGALQGQMENVCGLAQGELNAPEAYFNNQEVECAAPLPVGQWLGILGPEEKKILFRRYARDAHLLNGDQKQIFEAMAQGPEFAHLQTTDEEPLVTVLTMTYNQERFIKKCMDSVLAQRTNFPVRHIVLDHHSTDGTAQIVADYASRHASIMPVLLSQRREHENVRGLYLRCKSRYAIFCDGDDYFLDPRKLQIQVDYLERHPDLSFCFHPVAAVYDDGSPTKIFPPMSMIPRRDNDNYELADLVPGNFIQTNSVLYRWRFGDGLPNWFRADICLTDWYGHMLHAETGDFGFIPRIMAAYRRHSGAMFAASSVSSVELRRKMGIAELVAIEACVQHFDKRHHPGFIGLACKVFKDFAIIAQEGDTALLDFANRRFPLFAAEYAKQG